MRRNGALQKKKTNSLDYRIDKEQQRRLVFEQGEGIVCGAYHILPRSKLLGSDPLGGVYTKLYARKVR